MYQENTNWNNHGGYDLSIVIVNYNGGAVLPSCLKAIDSASAGLKVQTIIVDNGSDDRSCLSCRDNPSIRVICLGKNLGFSAANNIGIREAQGRYYLLLNSDCFVQPGLFQTLMSILDENPRAAVVGPRLLNKDGTLQPSCHNFPSPLVFLLEQSMLWRLLQRMPVLNTSPLQIAQPHDKAGKVDWVLGSCMMVRPTALHQAGGFDNTFFFYWEEADLCFRLKQAGWDTLFEPAACAVHLGGGSTTQSDMLMLFFTSLYRFYAKHYSRRQFITVRALVRLMALLKAARYGFSSGFDASREATSKQFHRWADIAKR
jgi:GT2 family glycosyltransferase